MRPDLFDWDDDDFLDSVFVGGNRDADSRIVDSLVQRVELFDSGKVAITFNVLKEEIVAQIEKSPESEDLSRIIREDGSYRFTLVEHSGIEPPTSSLRRTRSPS